MAPQSWETWTQRWWPQSRLWFRKVVAGMYRRNMAIPLCDVKGNHIEDAKDVEEAKAAYARYVLRAGEP